jgi:hypothetical protein
MSTTWKIAEDTKDIVIDGFGNFQEITEKTKLEQDISEFLQFSLNEIIGAQGKNSRNTFIIRAKIREAIEQLMAVQELRRDITSDKERIKRIVTIEVNPIDGSKTNYSFYVEVQSIDGKISTSSGTIK